VTCTTKARVARRRVLSILLGKRSLAVQLPIMGRKLNDTKKESRACSPGNTIIFHILLSWYSVPVERVQRLLGGWPLPACGEPMRIKPHQTGMHTECRPPNSPLLIVIPPAAPPFSI
jgi:hypothetical protein